MRLLFDHNLSPRLPPRLADEFPGSVHVQGCGLERASDEEVWRYALAHGFAIVTKDSDFNDLCTARGAPPKVVWLQLGNCTRDEAEEALRQHGEALHAFARESESTCS